MRKKKDPLSARTQHIGVALEPYMDAIVRYYARKALVPKTEIIRGIIVMYARADISFDAPRFRAFVERFIEREFDDPIELQALRTQVDQFLDELTCNTAQRQQASANHTIETSEVAS